MGITCLASRRSFASAHASRATRLSKRGRLCAGRGTRLGVGQPVGSPQARACRESSTRRVCRLGVGQCNLRRRARAVPKVLRPCAASHSVVREPGACRRSALLLRESPSRGEGEAPHGLARPRGSSSSILAVRRISAVMRPELVVGGQPCLANAFGLSAEVSLSAVSAPSCGVRCPLRGQRLELPVRVALRVSDWWSFNGEAREPGDEVLPLPSSSNRRVEPPRSTASGARPAQFADEQPFSSRSDWLVELALLLGERT